MSWLSRIANALRPGGLNRELDEEIRFHIEERIDDLVRQGIPRDQARAAALHRFGSGLNIRETSQDIKSFAGIENVLRDLRFGLRMLRKHTAATAAAIVALALALGSAISAFAIIDALLFRPLPLPEPHRLIDLARMMPGFLNADGRPREAAFFSYPAFQILRESAAAEADLFAMTLSGGLQPAIFDDAAGSSENIRAESISGEGFRILGVTAHAGRLIEPADDKPGSPPVAVLSHDFWKRRFAGTTQALGRTVTLGRQTYQIAGVTAPGFSGVRPGYLTDLWTPLTVSAAPASLADPDRGSLSIWGRLEPHVAASRLRDALQPALTNFLRERTRINPPRNLQGEQLEQFAATPLLVRDASTGRPSLFRARFAQPLAILGLICALILILTAANVATILLARTTSRDREMALRLSLGASRGRLFQQTAIESAWLVALSFGLAWLIAAALPASIVGRLGPAELPAWLDVSLDWRVLFAGFALSVFTVFAIGLAPALRASSTAPNAALQNGGERQSARHRALRWMLAAQVGFSIAVLFLSGLLLQSFRKLITIDLGFGPANVALIDLAPREPGTRPAVPPHQLLEWIRRQPGVEAVSATQQRPMGGDLVWVSTPVIRLTGSSPHPVRPREVPVASGFFDALRIRWISGRDFRPEELQAGSPAVIVNQGFADTFFPGEDPLGKPFDKLTDDPQPVRHRIIGVVANFRYNRPREPEGPALYSPLSNLAISSVNVRTASAPGPWLAPLRKEIESAAPSLLVRNVTTLATQIDDTLLSERLLAMLAAYFSVIAILIASIGLYGVVSYAAVRRTREFGIRMVLGAGRFAVSGQVVREIALPVGLGIALGIALGLAAARHFSPLLYAVTPWDWMSLLTPISAMVAAAAIAMAHPVLRAARRDPVEVLRYE